MTKPIQWTITAVDEVNFSYYDIEYTNVPDFTKTSNAVPVTRQRLSLVGGWTDATKEGQIKAISQMQVLNYWGKPYSSVAEMPLKKGDTGVCKTKEEFPDPKPDPYMIDYKSARQQYIFYNQPCEFSEAVCASLLKKDNTLLNEYNEVIVEANQEFPPTWPPMDYNEFVKKYLTPMA